MSKTQRVLVIAAHDPLLICGRFYFIDLLISASFLTLYPPRLLSLLWQLDKQLQQQSPALTADSWGRGVVGSTAAFPRPGRKLSPAHWRSWSRACRPQWAGRWEWTTLIRRSSSLALVRR